MLKQKRIQDITAGKELETIKEQLLLFRCQDKNTHQSWLQANSLYSYKYMSFAKPSQFRKIWPCKLYDMVHVGFKIIYRKNRKVLSQSLEFVLNTYILIKECLVYLVTDCLFLWMLVYTKFNMILAQFFEEIFHPWTSGIPFWIMVNQGWFWVSMRTYSTIGKLKFYLWTWQPNSPHFSSDQWKQFSILQQVVFHFRYW